MTNTHRRTRRVAETRSQALPKWRGGYGFTLEAQRMDYLKPLSEDQRRVQRWLDEIMAARRLKSELEAEAYLRSLGPLRRMGGVRWLAGQIYVLGFGTAFAVAVAWALGGFR